MESEASKDRLTVALDKAFAGEVRRGVLISISLSWITLAFFLVSIAALVWTSGSDPYLWTRVRITVIMNGVGAVLSIANFWLAALSPNPLRWSYVYLLLSVIGFGEITGLLPGMLAASQAGYPAFYSARQDFSSILIIIAALSLPLSARLLVVAYGSIAGAWTVGIAAAFLGSAAARLYWGPFHSGSADAIRIAVTNAWNLVPDLLIVQLIAIGIFTAFLAAAVGNGRRFVEDFVRADVGGSILARFVPPRIARRIAEHRGEIPAVRRQVAILFVHPPEAALHAEQPLGLLQSFYGAVEKEVFTYEGIVDRFIGGPIMATFGALEDDPSARQKAFDCARAVRDGAVGAAGIALHSGEAVCGEIGTANSRVFGVAGDCVNAARRMLDVARINGDGIVTSDAVAAGLSEAARASLESLGETVFRGRAGSEHLWRA